MTTKALHTIPSYSFEDTPAMDVMADVLIWDKELHYNFHEPHAHDFHEILFFIKGGGAHLMGESWVEVESNDIHILPAQYVHQLQRSPHSAGFTLAFSSTFLGQMLANGLNPKLESIIQQPRAYHDSQKFYTQNSFYLKELIRQRSNRQVFYNIASILLLNLYQDLYAGDSEKRVYGDFGVLFLQMLSKHYVTERKVAFYATELGMGRTMLNRQLRKHFGKSFSELHRDKLLSTAKQKLKHTDASISEIAYDLGYSDPSYFSRYFLKHTGQNPTQYRSGQ